MSAFESKKERILSQLSIPDGEYTDLSPKGTIDAGIRDLVDEINQLDGFVTTSSCAGRVAIFLEGSKKKAVVTEDESDQNSGDAIAGVGGKGGGRWLFVSHDPVDLRGLQDDSDLLTTLDIPAQDKQMEEDVSLQDPNACQLLHLKFEPLVCDHSIGRTSERRPYCNNILHRAKQGMRPSSMIALEFCSQPCTDPTHLDFLPRERAMCIFSRHGSRLPREWYRECHGL